MENLKKYIIAFVLIFASCDNEVITINEFKDDSQSNNSDILQDEGDHYVLGGDIILFKDEENHQYIIDTLSNNVDYSRGTRDISNNIWPGGIIKYYFEDKSDFTSSQLSNITDAMNEIENIADVKFIESAPGKYRYKIVKRLGGGGLSTLGYCKNAYCEFSGKNKGTVIHEFLHGLSIKHEHSRYDRDKFIQIKWSNIYTDPDILRNFYMIPKELCDTFSTHYDYESIMHYPSRTSDSNFAIDITKPIINTYGNEVGQRIRMSSGDVKALKTLYGSSSKPIFSLSTDNRYFFPWDYRTHNFFTVELTPPEYGNNSVEKKIYIENLGGSNLVLTGTPAVKLYGSGYFSIAKQPSSNVIAPGEKTFFILSLQMDKTSTFLAEIYIPNNSDDYVDSFYISGNGEIEPFITAPFEIGNIGSILSETEYYFADLNNDNNVDMIYWNYNNPTLGRRMMVFMGNGDGSFNNPIEIQKGVSSSKNTKYYFVDINNDNNTDMIYWNFDHQTESRRMMVFFGNGDGTFKSPKEIGNIASSVGTTNYYFTDLDNDNKIDMVYWNYNNPTKEKRMMIYRGKGDGTFESPIRIGSIASSVNTTQYYFTDINNDNNIDMVYWNYDNPTPERRMMLYYGNGDCSFKSPIMIGKNASKLKDTEYYFADFNNDNITDMLYWNYDNPTKSRKMMVYNGNGDGSFQNPKEIGDMGSKLSNSKYYLADINNDDDPDLIYWNYENPTPSRRMMIYWGNQLY